MYQRLTRIAFTVVSSIGLAGCTLGQPTLSSVQTTTPPQTSMEILEEMELFLSDSNGRVPKLDPQQLKAGQHLQIVTGHLPSADRPEIRIHSTMIAGTVQEIDADQVVLKDAAMIKEGQKMNGVPVVSKVPYFSRMFKNSGVARESTSIPGEVTIELSEILHASELTAAEIEAVKTNDGGFERIGVDFDFADANDRDETLQ